MSTADDDPSCNDDTIWSRSPNVSWRIAPMYLALVQLDGSSIEVHGPGADVWEMLHSPLAHRDLIAAVAPKYSTSSSVVEHDIVALLSQLNDLGYVERIH